MIRVIALATMFFVGFPVGALVEKMVLKHDGKLKGRLVESAGPYPYRIGPGVVELRVEIYGTDAQIQCLEIDGELGQPGYLGSRGGDGGKGIFCGQSIAVFPGHAGTPFVAEPL